MSKEEIQKLIQETERKMYQASKEMNFIEAAALRDELQTLRDMLK